MMRSKARIDASPSPPPRCMAFNHQMMSKDAGGTTQRRERYWQFMVRHRPVPPHRPHGQFDRLDLDDRPFDVPLGGRQ